jgi:hypothetical protein
MTDLEGGSGIYNQASSPTLSNLIISGNVATDGQGGGMFNENNSSPILTNVSISGNLATNGGGGILNVNSSPTLTNVTISGNDGTYGGGGIANANSSPTLTNVIISGNSASFGSGGGMFNYSSSPILTNVTISGNTSAYIGGGMRNEYSSPKLYNSIVLGNNSGIFNISSTIDVQYSLVEGETSTANGNINATGITTSSVFVAPQVPGLSTTGNYLLINTSIVRNSGNNTLYENTGGNLITDKDLADNLRLSGGTIDMGAYEYEHIIYVKYNATGTNNGSSWANAFVKFEDGVNAATIGDIIFVAKGIYQPVSGQYFTMKEDVKIYGSFNGTESSLSQRVLGTSNVSVLQGNDHSVIRNLNSWLTSASVLDGFTVTGGNAIYDVGGNGGGIYNANASPTLTNLTISGNTGVFYGGGIFNLYSSPILTNVTISGNTSIRGAGIYNDASSPKLTNVTISGNVAENPAGGSFGGGMCNIRSSSPILTNVTISGNTAPLGGGIFNTSSSPKLYNSILLGNNSGVDDNYASSTDIKYSLVQGNTSTANGNIDVTGITAASVFVSPQTAGLSTAGNYSLTSTSIAINYGSNTLYTNAGGNLTADKDLAGNLRLFNNTIDMGAYELQVVSSAGFGKTDGKDSNDRDNKDGSSEGDNTILYDMGENSEAITMSVYPNPFNEVVSISIDQPFAAMANITVSDIQGKIIFSREIHLDAGSNQLVLNDLHKISKGVYFIKVSNDKWVKIQKVIKGS